MKEEYKLKRNNFSKEKEIISKRGKREKHFLQKDGTIVAQMYLDDIHFEKNGIFEEIDNTLEKVGNYYKNKNNSFNVYFKNVSMGKMMGYELPEGNLSISLPNNNNVLIDIVEDESKLNQIVKYKEIFDGIDFEYKITPTKVKENIIIKNKEALLDEINFKIETDLELKLNADGSISAIKNNRNLFVFDLPYIVDASNKINYNVSYVLKENLSGYDLNLMLNRKLLCKDDIIYPIIVDPTITVDDGDSVVYDTYIYPGDTSVDRNNQDVLKAGVERVNGKDIINRTLVKFELPNIGTGSQIYESMLQLVGNPFSGEFYEGNYVDVHRVTTDWSETTANWNAMNDKYDSRIEASNPYRCGYIFSNFSASTAWNITALVKRWYTDLPNYGVLIKAHNETYSSTEKIPKFYSKNNNISGDDPKPLLTIVYYNQNGLEDYMDYESQEFSECTIYENTYNGNLVGYFELGETEGNKCPAILDLYYNTNDILLNNSSGFGLGYKLNVYQTIKEELIDGITYLKYIDEDGTIHYFFEEDGTYIDEDGLAMTITVLTDKYILKDSEGNSYIFEIRDSVGYLTEYIDIAQNRIAIIYNSNNNIVKIVDDDNQEIQIIYEENKISIVSPKRIVYLYYDMEKLIKISTFDGDLLIDYNENNIISKVTDKDGLYVTYEYYDNMPYKVKKVTEYGIDGNEGYSFVLEYGNNVTTLVDNCGRATTLNYNTNGNVLSLCDMKSKNDVKNAYGAIQQYFNNDLMAGQMPTKHVKNHLKNICFSNNEIYFSGEEGITIEISEEYANSGSKSLKINNHEIERYVSYEVEVPKGNYYTFSGFIKNDNNIQLLLEYQNNLGEWITEQSDVFLSTPNFKRQDITIFYPEDANSNLFIKLYLISTGNVYLDDVQLEEGETANLFNYLENSDFSQGLTDWVLNEGSDDTSQFEVVTLDDGITTALKISMDPEPDKNTIIQKEFDISGDVGDVFNISFWYKNNGIFTEFNTVTIQYDYVDEVLGTCISTYPLNPSYDNWQYVSLNFGPIAAYKNVKLNIFQTGDANELYITNLSLFKGMAIESYEYDSKGNLIGINDLDNNKSNFLYDKNSQIIKAITPKGGSYKFEYDNRYPERELSCIFENGVNSQVRYDLNGNVVSSITSKKNSTNNIESGLYKIRLKGTNKYIENIQNNLVIQEKCSMHNKWNIEKTVDGYYKIGFFILDNKYLTVSDEKIVLSAFQNDNSLFSFIENNNGSYLIKQKDVEKYLNVEGGKLNVSTLKPEDYNYEFYLEEVNEGSFIETGAEYTTDGLYIKNIEDSRLNKTACDIDVNTGLLNSVTGANGNQIFYEYDDKYQLIKTINGKRVVRYTYERNLLKRIETNNVIYNFIYDNFLNGKSVKIGDNITLATNTYDSKTDNLLKTTYGNNDIVNYEYDEFNRLAKMANESDIYEFKYGNNGELLKIISNNHFSRYYYDLSQRLLGYKYDDFKVDLQYDLNGNVISTNYSIGNINETVQNKYDKDDMLLQTTFDSNTINYVYDELGRIVREENNNIVATNEFLTNGKRITNLIKKRSINGDEYLYRYDESNGITHIFHNGKLERKFLYNEFNELIEEKDYLSNQIIKYYYDNSKNIILKKILKLDDYSYVSQDKYRYSNSNWKDLLTQFNDESITYDEIGNPLTIGDNISLIWCNGRQLKSYSIGDKQIDFEYNEDSIRTSKKINNQVTQYYLKDTQIIFEKTGDNVIYYMRNEIDDLIGFKYNNSSYYYLKNIFGDILSITNSNGEVLANYTYDSWGNILSVMDSEGNQITDENHIAHINPYRYRGYYYDRETGLYYLNTRYYNPKWGRFINADGLIALDSDEVNYNLFAYASNDPINMIDSDGTLFWSVVIKPVFKFITKKILKPSNVKKVTKSTKKSKTSSGVKKTTTTKKTSSSSTKKKTAVTVSTSASVSTTKKTSVTTKGGSGGNKSSSSSTSSSSSSSSSSGTKTDYTVYVLQSKIFKKVQYVGRTVNPKKRENDHSKSQYRGRLEPGDKYHVDSYEAMRGLEQSLILRYKSLDKNNPAKNQINGVRWDNPRCKEYMEAALPYLKKGESYVDYCK